MEDTSQPPATSITPPSQASNQQPSRLAFVHQDYENVVYAPHAPWGRLSTASHYSPRRPLNIEPPSVPTPPAPRLYLVGRDADTPARRLQEYFTYIMFKIRNGWQHLSMDEIETLLEERRHAVLPLPSVPASFTATTTLTAPTTPPQQNQVLRLSPRSERHRLLDRSGTLRSGREDTQEDEAGPEEAMKEYGSPRPRMSAVRTTLDRAHGKQ